MTISIALLLGVIFLALIFFSLDWIAPDVVALSILLVLVFLKLLPPDRAFEGFGSDTVITILGLLILTAALLRTGVIDIAGRQILKVTGNNPKHLLLVIMLQAMPRH